MLQCITDTSGREVDSIIRLFQSVLLRKVTLNEREDLDEFLQAWGHLAIGVSLLGSNILGDMTLWPNDWSLWLKPFSSAGGV